MKDRPRRPRPALPFLLTLFTLGALIASGELALRLFVPDFSLKYGDVAFSERYHHIGPHLRDRLRAISRSRETDRDLFTVAAGETHRDLFTVAVIGDSFVEGYGVKESDRFTDLLQERFNRAVPGGVQIVNLGHLSYSTVIYDRLFRDILPTLKPDLVIIGLDQTDPVDDVIYRRDLARPGVDDFDAPFTHTILKQLSTKSLQFWLYVHSRMFLLGEQLSVRYTGQSFVSLPLAKEMAERSALKTRLYIATCQSPESTGEFFAVERTYIDHIDQAARGRVPVLFVTYPRAEHLAGQPKTTLINGAIADQASSPVYSEYWLTKTGSESQFTSSRFLHTAAAFRRESSAGSIMYFHQGDMHWNPNGHRLFADVLYPVILEYLDGSRLPS